MKKILEPENRGILERFIQRNTLLAFDYDGTLAPIVAQPSLAWMRPRTHELLSAVAQRFPTAIITGRARNDVMQFLAGIPVAQVVGNHGFEVLGPPPHSVTRLVESWKVELHERLASESCVVIEDKRYSLALHFRACADHAQAATAVRQAAVALDGARLIGGKSVLNVIPQDAPTKGDALLCLCERLGCQNAVFVGDDETDEDVFVRQGPDVLGIRVEDSEHSAAHYALGEQADVDELLSAIDRIEACGSSPVGDARPR